VPWEYQARLLTIIMRLDCLPCTTARHSFHYAIPTQSLYLLVLVFRPSWFPVSDEPLDPGNSFTVGGNVFFPKGTPKLEVRRWEIARNGRVVACLCQTSCRARVFMSLSVGVGSALRSDEWVVSVWVAVLLCSFWTSGSARILGRRRTTAGPPRSLGAGSDPELRRLVS
jgi:hypothetical protein